MAIRVLAASHVPTRAWHGALEIADPRALVTTVSVSHVSRHLTGRLIERSRFRTCEYHQHQLHVADGTVTDPGLCSRAGGGHLISPPWPSLAIEVYGDILHTEEYPGLQPRGLRHSRSAPDLGEQNKSSRGKVVLYPRSVLCLFWMELWTHAS